MILDIPALINGYEITKCIQTNEDDICETYMGKGKQQKEVILLVINMNALKRRGSKKAFFKELSCYKHLCSPSFMPLLEQVSIRNDVYDIQMMVFSKLPSMVSLKELLMRGNMKEEYAWNIITDIVIAVKEISYKSPSFIHFALNIDTIYVYQNQRGKLRGIIIGFQYIAHIPSHERPGQPASLSNEKCQQFYLATFFFNILQGCAAWNLPMDITKIESPTQQKEHQKNIRIVKRLELCFKKALHPDPSKRYNSLDDFIKALMYFSPFQMPTTFECFGKP